MLIGCVVLAALGMGYRLGKAAYHKSIHLENEDDDLKDRKDFIVRGKVMTAIVVMMEFHSNSNRVPCAVGVAEAPHRIPYHGCGHISGHLLDYYGVGQLRGRRVSASRSFDLSVTAVKQV